MVWGTRDQAIYSGRMPKHIPHVGHLSEIVIHYNQGCMT